MKQFLKKLVTTIILFFVIIEFFSKFVIDPLYFRTMNTYNEKKAPSFKSIYKDYDSKHVDILFIGSSRVIATINPLMIKKQSKGKVIINAGRGYMTPGINYQAIKNKLKKYPNFLKNAIVVLEYVGTDLFLSNFENDELWVSEPIFKTDKPMPHLLIPHLDINSFLLFLKKSKNKRSVKTELSLSYLFSSYRDFQYINERFNALNKPFVQNENNTLASEGGIRNDNIEFVKQKAVTFAKQQIKEIDQIPLLTEEVINNSSLAKLQQLIANNGGKLMVYRMPLHSTQQKVYSYEKAQKNKVILENWLKSKNIPIIDNPQFHYKDVDFPDIWHLSLNRRDEFTTKIYEQIMQIH